MSLYGHAKNFCHILFNREAGVGYGHVIAQMQAGEMGYDEALRLGTIIANLRSPAIRTREAVRYIREFLPF